MKHLWPLLRRISVAEAAAEIDAHPELWDQHKLRTESYDSPHGKVSDIWVRYNAFENFDPANPAAFNEPHESEWYATSDCLPSVKHMVLDTMRLFACTRLGGVLITRIPPGGKVLPHIDRGWHAEYYEKIAISLKAAPGQKFCFEDGEYESAPGDVFAFDNSYCHWVNNDSNSDRVTLIICVRRS